MVPLLTAWSSQVVCGTKHGLLSPCPLQTCKAAFAAAHTTQAAQPAPGWGQGSQAHPQGRAIMSQAGDKKQGPGLACNAPQQWSLPPDRWDVLCRWGVWCYGERANILGNAGWVKSKNLLHMNQEDAGLTDESENNPVLLITVRDLLQLQRNVKTNQ